MKRPANSRREILFQLTDVARTMRTYIDQRAREHGMTRAQWGVLLRLRAAGGHDAGRDGREPRDPADLAGAPDRPAVRARPGRAAPASARPARQSPLPDRQGARHARCASSRSGREISADCWPRSTRRDVAELLQKLLLIKQQHPQRGRQARCRQRRPREVASGARLMRLSTFTQLRSVCRADAADAVAARDADADRPRARRPPSGSSLSLRAAAMCPPTMPTSAPRRC